MNWSIGFSKESLKKFNSFNDSTKEKIKEKLNKLEKWLEKSEVVNLDIKRLKGEWEGFFRIRIGEIRILITFDNKQHLIQIHDIGTRGKIY